VVVDSLPLDVAVLALALDAVVVDVASNDRRPLDVVPVAVDSRPVTLIRYTRVTALLAAPMIFVAVDAPAVDFVDVDVPVLDVVAVDAGVPSLLAAPLFPLPHLQLLPRYTLFLHGSALVPRFSVPLAALMTVAIASLMTGHDLRIPTDKCPS
jgi:hypothetical protein